MKKVTVLFMEEDAALAAAMAGQVEMCIRDRSSYGTASEQV